MMQRPVAIGLLVCEQIIFEEGTRNITLVNSFTHRIVEEFPSEPFPFVVFGLLTDGLGDISVEMRITRLDNWEVIYRRFGSLRFTDPLKEIRCIVLLIVHSQYPANMTSCCWRTVKWSLNEDFSLLKGEPAMNTPHPEGASPRNYPRSDSRNTETFILDGPGDPIEPLPPNVLAVLMAQRERQLRLLEQIKQEQMK